MPKKSEKLERHYGDCNGNPVVEYEDSEGKHVHCAKCGFWRSQKSEKVWDSGTKIKEISD